MEYVEDHLEPRFASIDNHYIYMLLSSGYLGVLLFLLLGACTIYYLAKQAGRITAPYSLFAASTCGVLVAQMFLMLTVWLARDFGFMFLSTFGLAASWRAHTHVLALEERPSWIVRPMARQPGRGVPRRLVPGHPS
jgi:O-antigen ligase